MTVLRACFNYVRFHAGRRGAFLLFLAILDVLYGYSLAVTSAPQQLEDLLLPWQAWAIIWMVVGGICLTGVLARFDRIQFALAAALQAAWGLLSIDIWIVQGVPRGWASVVLWLSFAAVTVIISGWPELDGRSHG